MYALLYVLRVLIIPITRLCSSCPNPLRTLINDTNHPINPTRVPVRLPRHHTPPPFLLSIYRAQLPDSRSLVVTQRRQFVLMRKTMASYGRRTQLASRWSQSCFAFCLFSLIVSLLSWLLSKWEIPLNTYYSLILRPYPRTPLWKPCPGALPHLPVFQEIFKIRALVRTPHTR